MRSSVCSLKACRPRTKLCRRPAGSLQIHCSSRPPPGLELGRSTAKGARVSLPMIPGVAFRLVVGFEDYAVSSDGRVWNGRGGRWPRSTSGRRTGCPSPARRPWAAQRRHPRRGARAGVCGIRWRWRGLRGRRRRRPRRCNRRRGHVGFPSVIIVHSAPAAAELGRSATGGLPCEPQGSGYNSPREYDPRNRAGRRATPTPRSGGVPGVVHPLRFRLLRSRDRGRRGRGSIGRAGGRCVGRSAQRSVYRAVRHRATQRFWACYSRLPLHIQRQADRCYGMLRVDPHHASA